MSGTTPFLVLIDTIAKAIHEEYLANITPTPGSIQTVLPWEELSEESRRSYRRQAFDIVEKVRLIDLEISPLMPGSTALDFTFTSDQVEWLAQTEHDRWSADKIKHGWIAGPDRNDNKKVHPDLVPWDELSESSKEMDRDAARAIPRILATAGLMIRPADSAREAHVISSECQHSVFAVAPSTSSLFTVSESDNGCLKVLEVVGGTETLIPRTRKERITAVAVTPDGRYIVSGSQDGTFQIWDVEAEREILTLIEGHSGRVSAIALTPDGRRAVSGAVDGKGGELKVWDLEVGRELLQVRSLARSITAIAVSPDCHHAISGSADGTVEVWDLSTGEGFAQFKDDTGSIGAITLTPDGRQGISGSENGDVKVWDLTTGGEVMRLRGQEAGVKAVAMTPDGRHVLSIMEDGNLHVWDLRTKTENLHLSLSEYARTLHHSGDPDGAMAPLKEQERICRELGNVDGLQRSLGNQAMILRACGNLDSAMALLKESEGICRENRNLEGMQISLGHQALIFLDWGDYDTVIRLVEQQEDLCRTLDDVEGVAACLNLQAIAHAGLNHTTQADHILGMALSVAQSAGNEQLVRQIQTTKEHLCKGSNTIVRGDESPDALAVDNRDSAVQRTTTQPIDNRGTPARELPQQVPSKRRFMDTVECGVFSPPSILKGETILIQAHCYVKGKDTKAYNRVFKAISKFARSIDKEARIRGKKTLDAPMERGQTISFHLEFFDECLSVNTPMQHLVWRGQDEYVGFLVTASDDCIEQDKFGTLTIFNNTTPVGSITFKLQIVENGSVDRRTKSSRNRYESLPFKKAFIAYSSDDRSKVLERIPMLDLQGIEYHQDILSLKPGDLWMEELDQYIDECDLFLIFWSKAAKKSKHVRREIKRALGRQGDNPHNPPKIIPVIIEKPSAKPCRQLKHIHLDDYIYCLQEHFSPD